VLLEILTCAETTGLSADLTIGLGLNLGNILCEILPIFCPPKPYKPKPPQPPKATTVVKTTTEVVTVTDTIVSTTVDTVTATVTVTPTPSPTPSATNVCGALCDTTCSSQGQLPPSGSDCDVLVESIGVFQGTQTPTFVVQPMHIQQLTFQTCRLFFENLGTVPLEYCWQDLANTGSLAASTCFPPTMPVQSLGICEALDTTWEVGVGHS